MERRDARLFQQDATIHEGWNIVELESHRQFRRQVNELIQLTNITGISTSELQQRLAYYSDSYGTRFATLLVRALHRENVQERQSIVWLLTLLDDPNTIPHLQHMSRDKHIPRSIRLSASLALAGMGATPEVAEEQKSVRMYAIS